MKKGDLVFYKGEYKECHNVLYEISRAWYCTQYFDLKKHIDTHDGAHDEILSVYITELKENK